MKQILITGNTVAVKAVAANRVGDIPVYITDHSLLTGEEYTICGYRGKQVRDNIHSSDLIQMFRHFYRNPRKGEVYNAGGGRFSNCSMQEAIA
ncbi:MAG: hypothetical protein LBD45_06355, partial [Bacteroidales bacterium]|nr:hypothetical protein [Bacteroidales bacterium]